MRVRGRDVMWQKERLLNVAIENVPLEFTKIAWLDCDLLFANENWAGETSRLLDRYPVVQPFETVVRLPRGVIRIQADGERWTSFAAAYAKHPHALLTGDFVEHGHTGFAWAARREILASHGLYDGCVAGSGRPHDGARVRRRLAWPVYPAHLRRQYGALEAFRGVERGDLRRGARGCILCAGYAAAFVAWRDAGSTLRSPQPGSGGISFRSWRGRRDRSGRMLGVVERQAGTAPVGRETISACGRKTELWAARRKRLREDTIQDVVERIHRYGDRGRNAGDGLGEQEARNAALQAQGAPTVEDALRIEEALQMSGEDAPVVGQQVLKKKKGWFRRLLEGDDDDVDTDNS